MEHITINSDRSVTVPVELRKIGVQYDHNVNTIEFVGPRYSSNVDLSTMTIYINYILSDKTPGKYKAENVIIDDQDDSLIRFNWTITRNVTKVSGILSCLVCAKKTDEEGNEINHWNTDIFRLLSVSEGMENDLVIQEQYPDVITSLIQNVEEHDTKLLEFSGLNNRVTDLENNIDELKDDLVDVKDNLGFLFSHTGQEASTQFIADYKIVAGHTYLFKNNSQSTSLIVSSKASDKTTTIETFSSGLAKNEEITFTATLDAPYLRVWTNSNIGSWSITDLTGINARVEQLEKDSIRFNDNYDVVSEIYKNRTLNLFDGNVTNGKVISSSDGSLIDNELYRTSDFIKVEADTVYTFYKFTIVGYYTDKKVFIKRDYCRENNVTPINCAYVRLSTDLTSTAQMVLKGSYETIYYEAYKKTIGKELIENERWKENTYFNHIPIGYYQANEQIFWNPTERSVNDIYGIYDELVSNYSDYVSKEVLGTDQSGLYEVYKYSFKPVYPTSPNNKKHLPKIVIFSGVHGLERWSTYAIAQLMKAICNDNGNNEILEYLRYNVEFIVVPLVNPWGYIESTRWNSRGVNINRNFDYNWSVSGDEAFTIDYEGTEPFSECETTYVKKILYENLDAVGVIDAHTHDTTSWNNVYWHNLSQKAKSYDDMTCVSKNNISSMTRKMKNVYNLVFDGFIGNVDYGNTACLTGYATCVCELNGVTGEATDKLPSESQSGSALTNRTNVEFYANLICNILRYFYIK